MAKEWVDRAGRSGLHDAIVWNPHEVPYIIRAGADVNLQDKNGYTPLHFAAQQQEAEIARLLLDAGATVDARDEHGNTPLSNAVFYYQGDGAVIRLLRERGADPFAANNHGVSPVSLARMVANYDVARFFDDLPK
jgi:ankyrin repeat protein